jgi:hypothetical protein
MQINQGKRSKFIHIKWLKQKKKWYVMMQYFLNVKQKYKIKKNVLSVLANIFQHFTLNTQYFF